MGGDPTKLIHDCARVFNGWDGKPYFIAVLVRSVETGQTAFRDGADELMTKGTVYRDMLDHPLTYHWYKVFHDEWIDIPNNGLLAGVPVEDHHSQARR